MQRVELLAGEIEEARGDYAKAREHYELVTKLVIRTVTEAIDEAKARLEALDERGL